MIFCNFFTILKIKTKKKIFRNNMITKISWESFNRSLHFDIQLISEKESLFSRMNIFYDNIFERKMNYSNRFCFLYSLYKKKLFKGNSNNIPDYYIANHQNIIYLYPVEYDINFHYVDNHPKILIFHKKVLNALNYILYLLKTICLKVACHQNHFI